MASGMWVEIHRGDYTDRSFAVTKGEPVGVAALCRYFGVCEDDDVFLGSVDGNVCIAPVNGILTVPVQETRTQLLLTGADVSDTDDPSCDTRGSDVSTEPEDPGSDQSHMPRGAPLTHASVFGTSCESDVSTSSDSSDEDPLVPVFIPVVPLAKPRVMTHSTYQKVADYLLSGTIPDTYGGRDSGARRRAWTQNCRRRFRLHKGVLQRRVGQDKKSFPKRLDAKVYPWRTIPTEYDIPEILKTDHECGHDKINRMEGRVSRQYYIPNIRELLTKYKCAVCQEWKPVKHRETTPIYTSRPLQLVMFDLTKMPMRAPCGSNYILSIVDHFTKYKWACYMDGKDVDKIAAYLGQIFRDRGSPERWHCDNGTEFLNAVMDKLRLDLGGIPMSNSMPRNPRCQGIVEKMNGVLKAKILKRCRALGYLRPGQVVVCVGFMSHTPSRNP
jgi:hypothetical protein